MTPQGKDGQHILQKNNTPIRIWSALILKVAHEFKLS